MLTLFLDHSCVPAGSAHSSHIIVALGNTFCIVLAFLEHLQCNNAVLFVAKATQQCAAGGYSTPCVIDHSSIIVSLILECTCIFKYLYH